MTYPSSITAFSTKTDGVSYPQAAHVNLLQDDVMALEEMNLMYKITPSVTSNNLTVAIKHLDGSNPSAGVPLYFKIANTWQSLSGALSVTKNAATNWCNAGGAELATKEIDYFVYICWNTNTSAVDVFFSRIPYGRVYSQFSATTTNEKYAAINATAPAATDDCVNIGRFAATLSAGAGYTWTVPAFTTANLIQRPITETRLLTYVPATSGLTLTSGTLAGNYRISYNQILVNSSFIFGASSAVTGSITETVPMASLINLLHPLWMQDSGTNTFVGTVSHSTGSTVTLYAINSAGTYTSVTALSSTIPFTWAINDFFSYQLIYEF